MQLELVAIDGRVRVRVVVAAFTRRSHLGRRSRAHGRVVALSGDLGKGFRLKGRNRSRCQGRGFARCDRLLMIVYGGRLVVLVVAASDGLVAVGLEELGRGALEGDAAVDERDLRRTLVSSVFSEEEGASTHDKSSTGRRNLHVVRHQDDGSARQQGALEAFFVLWGFRASASVSTDTRSSS